MVELQNVTKTFFSPSETTILKDVSLILHPRELLAIMGPSGTGKSTLLNIIGSLDTPTSGQILIDNISLSTIPAYLYRRKYVSFIFQSYNLLENHTALDNLLMVPSIARQSTHKQSLSYQRAMDLLKKMGLIDRSNFSTKLLSGGEKQRIAVARALMSDAPVILADEPTGNLDKKNSLLLHDLLIECCKEYQKSMILVTHDNSFAQRCDRLLTLDNGLLSD